MGIKMVHKQKEGWRLLANPLLSLVRPARFERATYGFVVQSLEIIC